MHKQLYILNEHSQLIAPFRSVFSNRVPEINHFSYAIKVQHSDSNHARLNIIIIL